ncbi:hypothetical protein L1049_028213 [Liquidambar formosana]|uniref:Mediator of RNA polymerase II transcription subunit 25 n=1 Tax=Liquidambar formosana TaxID=63359 RepID=A0AAP0RJA4_LIQFO
MRRKQKDTEMMAQTFIQYSVSLSVISSKQLPTLKAIYDVGNTNAQAADPFFNDAKNSEFLVLLSKNFVEALTALDRQEITSVPSFQSLGGCALNKQEIPSFQSLLEMEANWVTPDLEPTTPTFTDDDIILLRQLISEPNETQPKSPPENILTATVNGEVEPAFPQIPYVPPGTSQSGSGSQQTPRPWDGEQRNVKVWEGDLTALVYGQSIPVSSLVAYRTTLSSEMLAANWLNTLQLSDQLIPQNSIDNLVPTSSCLLRQ